MTANEHTFEKEWTKLGNCGTVIVPQFSMYLCISLNVIADAIAFKHELVPPSGPISMIASEKAHSGISPWGAEKKRGIER